MTIFVQFSPAVPRGERKARRCSDCGGREGGGWSPQVGGGHAEAVLYVLSLDPAVSPPRPPEPLKHALLSLSFRFLLLPQIIRLPLFLGCRAGAMQDGMVGQGGGALGSCQRKQVPTCWKWMKCAVHTPLTRDTVSCASEPQVTAVEGARFLSCTATPPPFSKYDFFI